jgi:isoamylase
MLLGGDEFRRTQEGNNNAYCQDNEISWYDWSLLEKHRELHRFTRGMIAFRHAHPVLRKEAFYTDADIQWFSPQGTAPDWLDAGEKRLACLIRGQSEPDIYLMFNASSEAVAFVLPPTPRGGKWHLAADTFRSAPQDLPEIGKEIVLDDQAGYQVGSRASVILLARQ